MFANPSKWSQEPRGSTFFRVALARWQPSLFALFVARLLAVSAHISLRVGAAFTGAVGFVVASIFTHLRQLDDRIYLLLSVPSLLLYVVSTLVGAREDRVRLRAREIFMATPNKDEIR